MARALAQEGNFRERHAEPFRFYPQPTQMEIPQSLPDQIERAFVDATNTLAAPTASVIMTRRVIEQTMKDQTPELNNLALFDRIEAVAESGHIPKTMCEWAHHIRTIGNMAAHGDSENTREEAIEALEFCRYLLLYLYSIPKRISQARLAAQSKRQAQSPAPASNPIS